MLRSARLRPARVLPILLAVVGAAAIHDARVVAAQASPQSVHASVAQECAPPRIPTGNFICGPADELDVGGVVLAAGDLDGNLSPEVATLQNGRLVLFVNPDVGDDSVVASVEALDVCAPPGQARFLFSTPAGLRSLELQGDQTSVGKLADGGGWKGARQLRACEDGSLFVLGAERRTLYRAKPDGAGFLPLEALFTVPYDVREFHLLDWDPAVGPELALLGASGIQVRRGDGAVLLDGKALAPGSVLTPVARAGARDGLAWITRFPDGLSYLFYFLPELGSGFEGPLPLGPERYDSVDAGDLEGDGDEDLVLGARASTSAQVLRNHAGATDGSSFTGIDGAFDLSLGKGSLVLASGRVLCHDLFNARAADGSARPAVASLLLDPPGLRLVPQLEEASTTDGPKGTSRQFHSLEFASALFANACNPSAPPPAPRALWSITLGADWPASNATHVEAIVRVSSLPGLAPDRVALHHSMTPIPPEGLAGTSVLFEGLEGPAEPEDSSACYFVQLRPVRLDPAGQQILEAWRWGVVGVSAHCDGLRWLTTLPGAIAETSPIGVSACGAVLECDFGIPNGLVLGPVYIPSASPQLRVPSGGPGVLPLVWPWNY